jgi:hypothetical protein
MADRSFSGATEKDCPVASDAILSAAMPKIFEIEGFRFFIYSNEHRPIHVHVRHADGEAVFTVEDRVELRESQGLKLKELARAEELALEQRERIIAAWHEHLG